MISKQWKNEESLSLLIKEIKLFCLIVIYLIWRNINTFWYASLSQYLFSGVPLNKCYGCRQEIYAPCDEEIIKAEDGYKERPRVNLFSDLSVALKNADTFNPEKDDIQTVAGNYIIMKYADHVYAAFAHLQTGSVTVSVG